MEQWALRDDPKSAWWVIDEYEYRTRNKEY
jgi:hypothetical protein